MDRDGPVALFGDGATLVDLTHKMDAAMPVWPTHPRFSQTLVESYDTGGVACNHALCMSEHSGTHFDAPLHFVRGAAAMDEIAIPRFFGRMAKIDVRDASPRDAIRSQRICNFEEQHGALQPGDAVLFHFGWDAFWNDTPPQTRFLSNWPGLSGEAADLLVARQVRIVGTDCLSIDSFAAADYPAHHRLLGAGVLIGENFANLGQLPPWGQLISLPLAVRGGSGAPIRAVAVIERA